MTVQQQALKLELDEVFDEFWVHTESYVKGLIGKPWWHSTKQLLQNEGPLYKMIEHCLVYVVEEGDRIEGYKAYTAYLASEYGTSQKHNTERAELMDGRLVVSQAPLEALADNERVVRHFGEWLSTEEQDFMYLIEKSKEGRGSSGHGMQDAGKMLNMTVDEIWQKYRNIKQKAARRTP
jgi:hypothetical protein